MSATNFASRMLLKQTATIAGQDDCFLIFLLTWVPDLHTNCLRVAKKVVTLGN
jgi:hypothetical protein